jgi:D-sedoheptulose 7-phosphate isomerase
MELKSMIQAELQQAASVLEKFMSDERNIALIEKASETIAQSIREGGKVISCGNGGSHCDAMHFAEELTGKYRENRKAIPAICISDPSHISCVSNDYGYEFVFSRYIEALGNKGDVLLGISTSGNSQNIIRASQAAKEKGMKVIILSGKDGGKLAPLADVEIRVPHFGYADRIQEVHIKVIHILMLLIEKQLAGHI